ncbi:MAG: DGQHR domain-containing protein [Bacteroidales bacterium]|nr:DGQHR domain-containing protein [Bacteroidales bacterium]
MKSINKIALKVSQPIGCYYLTSLNASELCPIVKVNTLKDGKGPQRDPNKGRITEISNYCDDPDATFPTAIIVSINEKDGDVTFTYNDLNHELCITYNTTIGEVIDGQHRILGLKKSSNAKAFDLPVVFVVNPTNEQKAYIFSIINSKQEKVNASHIYELFGVIEQRSPYKTAHNVARVMNYSKQSPFYHRLKMLGKIDQGQLDATLSQGSFAKRLVSLISKNPDDDQRNIKRDKPLTDDPKCPFRKYFIDDRDDVIIAIMSNCFNALSKVFSEEWSDPKQFILWKSTGYNAIIDSIPETFELAKRIGRIDESLFTDIFQELKQLLKTGIEINGQQSPRNVQLTSSYFGSGESESRRLGQYLSKAISNVANRLQN